MGRLREKEIKNQDRNYKRLYDREVDWERKKIPGEKEQETDHIRNMNVKEERSAERDL